MRLTLRRIVLALAAFNLSISPLSAALIPVAPTFLAIGGGGRGSAVAYDSRADRYLVVGTYGYTWGRFVSGSGAVLGEQFLLTSATPTHFPGVAFSPDSNGGQGGFLVAWHETFVGGKGIRARMVSYATGVAPTVLPLIDENTSHESHVGVAYSTRSREFLVVWSGSSEIHAQRVSADGVLLGGTIVVGPVPGDKPSVAYNHHRDEFFVAYSGYYFGAFVNGRAVKAGSVAEDARLGPIQQVTLTSATFVTATTYNAAAQQYQVTWFQGGGVYGRTVAGDGTPLGAAYPVSVYGASDGLAISYNPIAGVSLAAVNFGYELGGVELDAAGQPASTTPTLLTSVGTRAGMFYPRTAASTVRGHWLVTSGYGYTSTAAQLVSTTASGGTGLPLTVTVAANVTMPVAQGVPVTWTATAAGGSGAVEYKFLRYTAGGSWVVAQNYSANNTFTWFPGAGSHAVQVWARTVGSSAAYDAYAGTDMFTVTPPRAVLTGFTASTSFPVSNGTPVTWTATASAGAVGVQYQFWRYSTSTGWVMARDYSTTNSYTWFPPTGTNAIQVWVRAAGSTDTYQDWRGSGLFNVTAAAVSPARLTALTSNVGVTASPQQLITFTAAATGGSGSLEYKFFLWDAGSGAWTVLRDWNASSQASYIPGVSGTGRHAVQVWVRSAGSSLLYEDWRSSNVYNVTDLATLALTPSVPVTSLVAGQAVTFIATTTGGSGPWEFAFMTFNGASWTLRQPYAANANSLTVAFPAGTAAVQVWVRQAGSPTAWESYTTTGVFTVR